MVYVKQTWQNLPNQTTPISAARLSHLETQYDEAVQYTDAAVSSIGGVSLDLVEGLRYPVFIAHRGGPMVRPEHSWEAYKYAFESGFSPEADVRALADGTLVCVHDATTARTMDISKSVSSTTVAEWRKARVRPPAGSGGNLAGTGWGTPVFFEDYLDYFGGKTVLWTELKDASAQASFCDAILDRSLVGSVVVQTSDLAVAQYAAGRGLHALLLTSSANPTTVVNSGIEFVGVPASASNSYVASCVSAGLKVISYTQNTKAEADAQISRGCVGVFSNDPWEVSRENLGGQKLDIEGGFIPPASQHISVTGVPTVTSSGGALEFKVNHSNSGDRNVLRLGQFGFGGASGITIRFWAQSLSPDGGGAEGGWVAGVYLGRSTGDGPILEEPTESMFQLFIVRRDGREHIFSKPLLGGSTSTLATVNREAYAPTGGRGEPQQFEVTFSPTSVTGVCLSRPGQEATTATVPALYGSNYYLCLAVTNGWSRIWDIEVERTGV